MADRYTARPETGGIVGDDGCDYASPQEYYHYHILGLCGCGRPEAVYTFLRSILQVCDRRETKVDWVLAPDEIKKLVLKDTDVAVEALLHLIDRSKVIEHGGSVYGSWLTPLGEEIVDLPRWQEEPDNG